MEASRVLLAAAVLASTLGCAHSQDAADQACLREIFAIPADVSPLEYRGFPAVSGFGQREGLRIAARYHLHGPARDAWVESARRAGGRELPFPAAVRSRFLINLDDAPLDTAHGLYLCRTAGNEILHAAETRPCDESRQINDVRLGIFNATTGELSVLVAAGY